MAHHHMKTGAYLNKTTRGEDNEEEEEEEVNVE